MKKRIDLELWHEDCWMLALTREHPDINLVVTDICSDGVDILAKVVLTADGPEEADLESIESETQSYRAVRSTDVLTGGPGALRIHTRYDANASIYTPIIESSLTPIGNIRVIDDREYWTLIADASEISASMGQLESVATVDVERVVGYENSEAVTLDLVDATLKSLSERQKSYLLTALDEGYYDWPRDVSATELAEQHDVSSPTALEHLRKGEARILQRVLEELRARDRSRPEL